MDRVPGMLSMLTTIIAVLLAASIAERCDKRFRRSRRQKTSREEDQHFALDM
ncbi:MAG: hypothetical protein ABIH41_06030 [Nanoarchaeota archaeon]